MDSKKYLNDFFIKSLLISGSASTIDNQWGSEILFKIDRHTFTDPLNVDIMSDPEQVSLFNKLMNENNKVIKWRQTIDSQQSIEISKDNKEEVLSNFLYQNYLMLSVLLFENLITLLKQLLELKFGLSVWDGKDSNRSTAKSLIKLFNNKFKKQIDHFDKIVVDDIIHFRSLHNLRLFRNCIVHHNSELEYIEDEFIKDQKAFKLNRYLLFFKVTKDKKLYLDKTSFKSVSDLYSQFAYLAYLCYAETK